MSVAELREYATEKSIAYDAKASKATLIALVVKALSPWTPTKGVVVGAKLLGPLEAFTAKWGSLDAFAKQAIAVTAYGMTRRDPKPIASIEPKGGGEQFCVFMGRLRDLAEKRPDLDLLLDPETGDPIHEFTDDTEVVINELAHIGREDDGAMIG